MLILNILFILILVLNYSSSHIWKTRFVNKLFSCEKLVILSLNQTKLLCYTVTHTICNLLSKRFSSYILETNCINCGRNSMNFSTDMVQNATKHFPKLEKSIPYRLPMFGGRITTRYRQLFILFVVVILLFSISCLREA